MKPNFILKQRRWKCTNPECNYDISDSFKFVNKCRRTTNASDMLIVYAYRDLMETSASIANRFHISNTHVHEVFDRYVKMDRLPLTDAIDLLRSRRINVTEPHFVSIPAEERNAVRYLISDMYNQYISYVDKYFPNAVPVVDSFHVIQ